MASYLITYVERVQLLEVECNKLKMSSKKLSTGSLQMKFAIVSTILTTKKEMVLKVELKTLSTK